MEQAEPSKEETKLDMEKTLEDLPVEVLVKIFNYLRNHDIRCGVALTSKKFQKICQNESLVPVKDLCIQGHYYRSEDENIFSDAEKLYGLRNVGAVFATICQSKYLTTLKIKALNYESVNWLVSTALQVCPKLVHLDIVDTFAQSTIETNKGNLGVCPAFANLCRSISKFGKNLQEINLLLHGRKNSLFDWMIGDYISRGCPKLKSFALESLDLYGDSSQFIEIDVVESVYFLSTDCKELRNLKFTKIVLDYYKFPEVKKMLPNCNVEFKNCGRPVIINGVDVFVPYDIFEYFEGGEIELMFTQNCTM